MCLKQGVSLILGHGVRFPPWQICTCSFRTFIFTVLQGRSDWCAIFTLNFYYQHMSVESLAVLWLGLQLRSIVCRYVGTRTNVGFFSCFCMVF